MSKIEETLNMDILIWSDYFWYCQEEDTIRRKPDDHVAVKTKLGSVLSGPLKEKIEVGAVIVDLNIAGRASYPVGGSTLDREVKRLWDLKTLGIREAEDSVHELFFDKV